MSPEQPVSPRRTSRRALALAAGLTVFSSAAAVAATVPAHGAPIGEPAAPFPTECKTGSTLTLGETVPIVADALKKRAPSNAATIDRSAAQLSAQLKNATVSTLVVTQRGSEVSPGQGVQATHGANALTQRVLSIKNGTYRDGYKLSSISVNDAIETVLVGLEANDQVVVNTVGEAAGEAASKSTGVTVVSLIASVIGVPFATTIIPDLVDDIVKYAIELPGIGAEYGGKAASSNADSTCLAPGDGTKPITRQVVKNAFDVDVDPRLTAFAKSLTLSTADCRPLANLSLDEAVAYVGATYESTLPKSERASYAASVKTVRANLRKVYISNAFVPKDEDELSGVFEKVASLPLIGGPGLTYVAGVLQNLTSGAEPGDVTGPGELTHFIPLSDVSVNAVFNGARAVNDLLPLKSAAEYDYASAQGAAKALCRISDEGEPYPGADETVYNPNPLNAKPAPAAGATSSHGAGHKKK